MEASTVDWSSDRLEILLEDAEFVLYRGGAARTTPARSALVLMPRSDHPRPQTIQTAPAGGDALQSIRTHNWTDNVVQRTLPTRRTLAAS
jgi:hypothetical protein